MQRQFERETQQNEIYRLHNNSEKESESRRLNNVQSSTISFLKTKTDSSRSRESFAQFVNGKAECNFCDEPLFTLTDSYNQGERKSRKFFLKHLKKIPSRVLLLSFFKYLFTPPIELVVELAHQQLLP